MTPFRLSVFALLLGGSILTVSAAEADAPLAKVWLFIAVDCPIANGYAPEISRLHDDYSAKGIEFLLVYPEPSLDPDDILEHRRDYGLEIEFRHDLNHELVKAGGASITPEVVVFAERGEMVYRGRIDDRYSDFGDRRNVARNLYLRDVLEQILAGNVVLFHEQKAIGCYIEDLVPN